MRVNTFAIRRQTLLLVLWSSFLQFQANQVCGDCSIQPDANGHVDIPTGTTEIAESAFLRCTSLVTITIPDTVSTIGASAFFYCTNLTSVVVPPAVTEILHGLFHACFSLASVTISPSTTFIGNAVFFNCASLTSFVIPPATTSVGDYSFYGCTSLTSLEKPLNISMGNRVFAGSACEESSYLTSTSLCSCESGSCAPTDTPTDTPTHTPTQTPTTAAPTYTLTTAPTDTPSVTPSLNPTTSPVDTPTPPPTLPPTQTPSLIPTGSPIPAPTAVLTTGASFTAVEVSTTTASASPEVGNGTDSDSRHVDANGIDETTDSTSGLTPIVIGAISAVGCATVTFLVLVVLLVVKRSRRSSTSAAKGGGAAGFDGGEQASANNPTGTDSAAVASSLGVTEYFYSKRYDDARDALANPTYETTTAANPAYALSVSLATADTNQASRRAANESHYLDLAPHCPVADEALGGGTRWVQGRHAHSTRAQDVGDDTSGDVLGPENGNVGAGADAVLYDTLDPAALSGEAGYATLSPPRYTTSGAAMVTSSPQNTDKGVAGGPDPDYSELPQLIHTTHIVCDEPLYK